MADIKVFKEGESILASDTNNNNNVLLSKINDHYTQVDNYVKGELGTIKSEVGSAKADLENKINELDTKIVSNFFNAIAPDYTKGETIANGFAATKAGWVNYRLGSSANYRQSLAINGVTIAENWQGSGDQRAGSLYITGMVFINAGQVITGTFNTLTFYPCKGFEEVE